MESMFSGCKSIKELDVSHFNTQNVTNMRSMFYECESLTKLDVSRFNTSKVEDMGLMFRSCKSIKNLDVSNFTTSHAKIEQMFYGCENLLKIDVSNFDTSNTKDLDYLFADCYSLSVLDLSNFVTTNVTDTQGMFRGLKLKTIYCGNLWNMENVTNSRYMFDNCTNLVGGKGTKFDSNHTDAEYARIDGGPNSPGYFTDINASAVPVISVTPTEIDFGLVEYGTIKTKTFKVTNAGNASLTFHVPQASKSDQYFEVSDADAEFTLAPGNTKEYTVTCHGLNKGYKAWVDFRIISNAENGEQTVRVNSVGWDSTPLLAANSLTMNVGDGESIEMHGSNMGTYEITNSNPDIVSVEKGGDHGGSGTIGRTDGKYSFGYTSLDITALACGTATVKVIDTGTNEETIVSITVSGVVPEAVDLGLPSGTLWATCNVGATKPEEIGGRYAWGETEEKTRYREDNYLYNGQDIGSDIQGTEYDVAHVKWGNPWQMPTRNQFQELRDNCTMEHTTLNGRDGYKFIGSNGNSIFLPVDDNLPNGMGHAYWSSTASGDSSARSFRLSGDEVNYTGWSRDSGFSVRPVKNINTAGSGSTTDSGAGGV
jgi:surface protein